MKTERQGWFFCLDHTDEIRASLPAGYVEAGKAFVIKAGIETADGAFAFDANTLTLSFVGVEGQEALYVIYIAEDGTQNVTECELNEETGLWEMPYLGDGLYILATVEAA